MTQFCADGRVSAKPRSCSTIFKRTSMTGNIYRYLADDHVRLDDALRRVTEDAGRIEMQAYAEFRAGLLRHISIEEKILLPAARAARGGKPLPMVSKLRLDHGALAALLVPTPTDSIFA